MIPFHEILLRLFFAAGMGALIGVGHNVRRRLAGIRTRIGFLGAGAILKDSTGLVGLTTAATIFVEAAIGMAAGGGFYAIAGATTGAVLFALAVLGWATEKLSLKPRSMFFRFRTPLAQNVASEVHSLLANMKISLRQFRVSRTGNNSVVEFEADVSNHQEEEIIVQLSREGVVTEIVPCEARP
jgi:putative Mg2+ transporter-C (MgtC) family protein